LRGALGTAGYIAKFSGFRGFPIRIRSPGAIALDVAADATE